MNPTSIVDVVETIRDMQTAGVIKSFAIGGVISCSFA
jgi:hypothetical protein